MHHTNSILGTNLRRKRGLTSEKLGPEMSTGTFLSLSSLSAHDIEC